MSSFAIFGLSLWVAKFKTDNWCDSHSTTALTVTVFRTYNEHISLEMGLFSWCSWYKHSLSAEVCPFVTVQIKPRTTFHFTSLTFTTFANHTFWFAPPVPGALDYLWTTATMTPDIWTCLLVNILFFMWFLVST